MTYQELAMGILATIGILIICVPIRMFADWLFEKWVCKGCSCKDCECYKKENNNE